MHIAPWGCGRHFPASVLHAGHRVGEQQTQPGLDGIIVVHEPVVGDVISDKAIQRLRVGQSAPGDFPGQGVHRPLLDRPWFHPTTVVAGEIRLLGGQRHAEEVIRHWCSGRWSSTRDGGKSDHGPRTVRAICCGSAATR